MSWRKCICLLTADRNAWGTWRSARVPGKPTVAWPTERKNIPSPGESRKEKSREGRQGSQPDFNMFLLNFQGGRPTSPSLRLTFRFLTNFLISWLSFNMQTYIDFMHWAVSILFKVSTGNLHCTILPHLPLESRLTLYFSVKMTFSFRTPKSLLTKLELSMSIKHCHKLAFPKFWYLEGRPWWSSSCDFMIQCPRAFIVIYALPLQLPSPSACRAALWTTVNQPEAELTLFL